jgi:hypothetical protein
MSALCFYNLDRFLGLPILYTLEALLRFVKVFNLSISYVTISLGLWELGIEHNSPS